MLFTTATFVLIFLPIVLAGFFIIGRLNALGAAAWLFGSSLVFYGYWSPLFTLLLVGSICANFLVGLSIAEGVRANGTRAHTGNNGRAWLVFGIGLNLGLLAYFKYANFFVDNLNLMFASYWSVGRVILPIGISFYTFTQIAFLVDTYQRRVNEYKFIHYGLFVTYFPHLVAGPVLHHAQMMPQFGNVEIYRFNSVNFVGGLTVFALGLFKKVVLADGISPYADVIFIGADGGALPDTTEAWLGALAYTFQLYFDFSGYSDMAIGLSRMFNVRLPFNFNSPYRSRSISEFWKRWHISLSNFLRDYLYIALGGNRHGAIQRYVNLAVTMLLGGLWHGAGWSFVLWGALHGLYLMINHGFRSALGEEKRALLNRSRLFGMIGWLLTMLSVIVGWVFFRAQSFAGAVRVLKGMIGLNGDGAIHPLLWNAGLYGYDGGLWCLALALLALAPRNSNWIGEFMLESLRSRSNLRLFAGGFFAGAVMLLVVINSVRDSVSAFIYFNF
jgi:alginate O-acetyltransferase complex protein AlgI